MKRRVIMLITVVCTVYVIFNVGLFVLQRNFIYFPGRNLGTPEQYGATAWEAVSLRSDDGMKITAWRHDAASGYPTLVYFHGNAGHIGDRIGKYSAIAEAGFGVVVLSYRGYGNSEGTPTEEGLYRDARAAINYALGEMGLPVSRLVLYGESLGTGVAIQMATEYPVAGIVLEAPYTSIVRRGQAMFPRIIPVSLLLKDRFASIDKIGQVKAPLLLFHGEKDNVVPVSDGREIFDAANEPKEGHFFPEVDHVQFDLPELVSLMERFGRTHGWFSPIAAAEAP